MDDLSARIDTGFGRVDGQFEALDRRFEAVDRRFEGVDRRFEAVDRRFEQVDGRFEQVHRDIGELRLDMTGQIDGLRHLMVRLNLALFLAVISVLAAIVARGG